MKLRSVGDSTQSLLGRLIGETRSGSGTAVPASPPQNGPTARPWWPAARRVLTLAFFALVIVLLVTQARRVDWPKVASSLRAYSPTTLIVALLLAGLSHAVYGTYDQIARRHTGHSLRPAQVASVAFISYAFNLNLGSLVGGVAFRYRLYSRLGLDTAVITQVLSLSLITNWLGYLWLAGLVFLFRPLELPPDWKIGSHGLQVLGAVLVALAVAYLVACARSVKRQWRVRGHEVNLPSARVALLQLGLSSLNWLLMATVVWVLLQQRIDYPTVLSVLLIAAVAGVITHVPAGIGVLEAVYVTLLSHRLPAPELLAALVAYRAMYYLLPLILATLLFMVVDARAKRAARDGEASAGANERSATQT